MDFWPYQGLKAFYYHKPMNLRSKLCKYIMTYMYLCMNRCYGYKNYVLLQQ